MANVKELNSPSLKKQKFQVFKTKSQSFGDEDYHYIYLSSENAKILLLVNKKVFFFLQFTLIILFASGVWDPQGYPEGRVSDHGL